MIINKINKQINIFLIMTLYFFGCKSSIIIIILINDI